MSNSADREAALPAASSATPGVAASNGGGSKWQAYLFPDQVGMTDYDRWFKWRMLFLSLVAASYLLKLVFFRDVALANFDIPSGREHAVTTYMNWRIVSGLGLIALYLFSYLKRWHFHRVAWAVTGIAAIALIFDYFNVYIMTAARPPQWMFGQLALRVAAIACLLLNAMNARRLPPNFRPDGPRR